MTVDLLGEHHLEFLSLEGGCTGSHESIHVKMPHCWESHVAAHIPSFQIDQRILRLTYLYIIYGKLLLFDK